MTGTVAATMRAAVALGLSAIPAASDGSKRPMPGPGGRWDEYQHRLPTPQEIEQWARSDLSGIGLVTGAVSGGLEMFELEGRAVQSGIWDEFLAVGEAAGLGPLLSRIIRGYHETTPSGGLHLLWRCAEIEGPLKLARGPAGHTDLWIETKGEGGFTIVAPSNGTTHPNGGQWELRHGGLDTIAVITPDERRAILDLARAFDRTPRPVIDRQPTAAKGGGGWVVRPGDDYNERQTWPALLEPQGWTPLYTTSDGNQHWRRPGKEHGVSATINENGTGAMYVFTSSTCFEPNRAYSKFSAYVVLEHGGDVTDAVKTLEEDGYGQRLQLVDLIAGQRDEVGQPADEEETEEERQPTSWQPVDLTDALEGHDLPAPEILTRPDGRSLIYRGRVHWFQGESESCKTWLALTAVSQVLANGGKCLWVDFEDDDRGVVSRLLALAVERETIRDRFTYVRPDEPLRGRNGYTLAWSDMNQLLTERYDLAVIDGVTEAMSTEGLNLLDNTDIALWQRLLPKRIAAVTGAAVVCIDHVTKNGGGDQARYAIGGQHKLAGVTGAAYRLEARTRLRRATLEPVEARIAVTVTKDRPGWVRSHASTDDSVGILTLTSWPDGGVTSALVAEQSGATIDMDLCRRILEHLGAYDGISGRKIEEAIDGKSANIRSALRWMLEEPRGWVRVERSGNAHYHYLTGKGREEFAL